MKYGNPIRQCRGYNSNGENTLCPHTLCPLTSGCLNPCDVCAAANKNTLEMVQYGVEGSTTSLECQARSPHVSPKWHLQRENSDTRDEVRAPSQPAPV